MADWVFRLTVTDSNSLTDSDDVTVPFKGKPRVKVSGTFVQKPMKVKISGAFVEKKLKIKSGGSWTEVI